MSLLCFPGLGRASVAIEAYRRSTGEKGLEEQLWMEEGKMSSLAAMFRWLKIHNVTKVTKQSVDVLCRYLHPHIPSTVSKSPLICGKTKH